MNYYLFGKSVAMQKVAVSLSGLNLQGQTAKQLRSTAMKGRRAEQMLTAKLKRGLFKKLLSKVVNAF